MPDLNSKPLVSVIALCYNQAKFVEETLDSIRNQTYKNIELIICDDFSTDDSRKIITNWVQKHNMKAKILFNEKNTGITKSVNNALMLATGSFVSFTACDDVLLPDKISQQLHEFLSLDSAYQLIYSDAYLIDENGKQNDSKMFIELFTTISPPPSGNIFDHLKYGNFIPALAILFKTEAFKLAGKFDETLLFEDWDFLLRLSRLCKFHYSKNASAKYRFHPGNNNTSPAHLFNARYENFKVIIKHLDDPYLMRRSKEVLMKSYLRGYPRFFEMLDLYKTHVGTDWRSKLLSVKAPFQFFKFINRIFS